MKIQEETDVKEYQIRKKKSREQTVENMEIKKRKSERQSRKPQRKKMNMLKKWECFRLTTSESSDRATHDHRRSRRA